ncbi:MAG TPA: type II secretion system F family protein, partial [Symbiobacteriaceae bacterium]|nr:type II secretion system F family protein [Symbiobacteriaceae bacterium]
MKFRYRGRDPSGKVREGELQAQDQRSALSMLQQDGLLVSHLEPAGGFSLNMEIKLGGAGRITTGELAVFCDQLSSLLGAGIPVLQALSVLARQFKGRRLESVVGDVIRSVEGGNSLSQAMREQRDHLPPTLVYITAVAEVSGQLEEAYGLLARQFEQEHQLARKVKNALTYPVAVMVIALCVVVFMLTFVLPTYSGMFAQMGAALPASTRFLVALSDSLRQYWYLWPLAPVTLWLGGRWLMRHPEVQGHRDRLMLRLPLWGALRYRREMARVSRTLATMTRAGVPLMAALLTIQGALEFQPLRQAIARVQEEVAEGASFGEALRNQPIFDRISVEMIALGEQAGTMEAMLFRVADTADKDVAMLLE